MNSEDGPFDQVERLLRMDMNSPSIAFTYHSWGLAAYIQNLEESIAHTGDQYQLRARRKLESRRDELEAYEYTMELNYIDEAAEIRIPGYARMSAIVLLWGMFESTVSDIAKYIREREAKSLKLEDVSRNNFLERARKYYSAVLDLGLPWNDVEIQEAQSLCVIRNKIAHRNGQFMDAPEERDRFARRIRSVPGVELQGSELVVTAQYVDFAARLVNSMLESLLESVCERYDDIVL